MYFSTVFASLLLALFGTPVFGQTSTTDTSSPSTTQSSESTSQSSSSQSATSSASQTATSSAGGSGGGGGAQPPSQLIEGLQSAGFSGMASALNQVSGSPGGNELYSKLQNGGGNGSYLIFAPNDQAVQSLPSSVTQNSSLLAEYLSYHFVRGQFDGPASSNTTGGGAPWGGSSTSSSYSGGDGQSSSTPSPASNAARATGLFGRVFAPRHDDSGNNSSSGGSGRGSGTQPLAGVWPNVTIGRTLLNASELVQLEGNQSQVLVWDRSSSDGNITVMNQAQNITVQNSTHQNQFLIAGINGTLIPPGNLTTALTAVNATVAQNLLQTVQVPGPNGNVSVIDALQTARGVTFFVPSNAAFDSQFNSTLPGLQNNATALIALLQNHYINGTTIYSSQIGNDTQAVTAAGQTLDFSKNLTGTFVQSSNGTIAQVVRPDVLLSNGVVHIVDRVFFDTNSNPSAAQSAFSSASSVAAQYTTASGPITGVIGGVGGSGGTSTESSQTSQTTDTSSQTQTTSEGGGGGTTETATATITASL